MYNLNLLWPRILRCAWGSCQVSAIRTRLTVHFLVIFCCGYYINIWYIFHFFSSKCSQNKNKRKITDITSPRISISLSLWRSDFFRLSFHFFHQQHVFVGCSNRLGFFSPTFSAQAFKLMFLMCFLLNHWQRSLHVSIYKFTYHGRLNWMRSIELKGFNVN